MVSRANRIPQPPPEWSDEFNGEVTSGRSDPPAGALSHGLGDGGDVQQGGILSGWSPPEWHPENSGLHFLFGPEMVKDMDEGGENGKLEQPPWLNDAVDSTAKPTTIPQPAGGGFFTGLTPYQSNGAVRSPPPAPGNDWRQLDPPESLEAGEHGSGYYIYGTDKTGAPGTASKAQWGTPKTMRVIGAVADRLATGGQYTPFGIGNISLQNRADFSGKYGHKDHNDGLSIDVRPARIDGAPLPVTHQSDQYDQDATQRLVDAFRSTGQVSKIYFNDPEISGVQPLLGHDNHLHVKLRP